MKKASSTSSEVNRLIHDIATMDSEELYTIHGVTINEDGTIYDKVLDKTFINANDWANELVEDSDDEYERFESKMSSNKWFDDGY